MARFLKKCSHEAKSISLIRHCLLYDWGTPQNDATVLFSSFGQVPFKMDPFTPLCGNSGQRLIFRRILIILTKHGIEINISAKI